MSAAPIRVAVTGAAGNIAYAILFRLASGGCFGDDQPIRLQLLEIPPAMKSLEGTVMELLDSAFPLLHGVDLTDDPNKAFDGVSAAFLVGSRPRTKDMDRADLMKVNGPIFTTQGKALDQRASRDVRVLVVGNPCNTNALIACKSAPSLPRSSFAAMTRLDENRSKAMLAQKLGLTSPALVTRLGVWGNHSNTMFPDFAHALANGKPVPDQVDRAWLEKDFIDTVANRGKAIIVARGASSAASAASAAIDHMKNWWHGTPAGDTASFGVYSDGQYDTPKDTIFSFPVTVKNRTWSIVEGIEHDEFAKKKIAETGKELLEERSAVADLLG
jgi:malate dehydrogenase